jgi:hypothetical protein
MLEMKKEYVVTNNNRKRAVLIDIETFEKVEEILESFGLAGIWKKLWMKMFWLCGISRDSQSSLNQYITSCILNGRSSIVWTMRELSRLTIHQVHRDFSKSNG